MINYKTLTPILKIGIPRYKTDLIIIHCADTKPKMDIGAKEINIWHKARGWRGIGYHLVIRRNGAVEAGRAMGIMGSHAKGYNRRSIGVCLVGGQSDTGKAENNFTLSQQAVLRELLLGLKKDYPKAKIIGHRDVEKGKLCPCFDVAKWCNDCGISGV